MLALPARRLQRTPFQSHNQRVAMEMQEPLSCYSYVRFDRVEIEMKTRSRIISGFNCRISGHFKDMRLKQSLHGHGPDSLINL